jgi:electron transfer flavoprotein alpha subunit
MNEMYGSGGSKSYALCLGNPDAGIPEAVDHVIAIDSDRIEPHDVSNLTNCVEELHGRYRFDAVLIPATTFGRMLAPRAAMRLHVGLVADVTAIRRRRGQVEMVRPAFSGRMQAGIVNLGRVPVMMTVRRNVFARPGKQDRGSPAEVVRFTPRKLEQGGIRLTAIRAKPSSRDIRESEVLVSGGGGVVRSFDQLAPLAEALGGTVSASRKVVDSGKAPRHVQVGQSGKTVSPRLYVAVGISGSIQHIVGLKTAECIIAVNSDRHAPICSFSDIVVECDAREFIPRMVRRIEAERQAADTGHEGGTR